MKLPTEQECLSYFDELKVPLNVKEHCLRVREVAVTIAKNLNVKEINLNLVSSSALLHDLFKPLTYNFNPTSQHPYEHSEEEIESWDKLKKIYKDMTEDEVAYHFFKDQYPLLAKTILNSSSLTKNELTWNELIIHYADWRVLKNKVVTLEERFNYLILQYPQKKTFFENYYELMKNEEKIIFSHLDFTPDDLNKMIGNNKEKEVKIKVDSFPELSFAKLIYPRALEENFIFDKEEELYLENKMLRLRRYNNKTYLTYKGPKEIVDNIKIRDEYELELDNFNEMYNILLSLGYQQSRYYEKYRQIYVYNNVKIMLDELPKMGKFIEIEGNIEDVKFVTKKLNLNMEDGLSEGYMGLNDGQDLRFEEK